MKARLISLLVLFFYCVVPLVSSFTPTGKQQTTSNSASASPTSTSSSKTTMSTLEKQTKGQIVGWWYKKKIVLNEESPTIPATSSLRAPNELVKEIRKKMLNIKSER